MVKRSEASSEAYPVALLRIAVGLKLRPQATLDEIVENTTRTMRLSRRKFRSYLAKHMALLAQAATDVETPAAKRSGSPKSARSVRPHPVREIVTTRRVGRKVKQRSPR